MKENGVELDMLRRQKTNINAPALIPRTDTLNINGLWTTTRQAILEAFIQLHDLDLLLL